MPSHSSYPWDSCATESLTDVQVYLIYMEKQDCGNQIYHSSIYVCQKVHREILCVCHGHHSFRSASLRIQWNGMELANEFEDSSLAETVDELQRSLKNGCRRMGEVNFGGQYFWWA